jgi:Xaa-Pro aminopeptidase
MHDHQRRLRTAIAGQRLDAAVLVSPAGVCHATGVEVFLPVDAGSEFAIAPTVAIVPADDGPSWLIVPDSHAARAREQAQTTIVEPVAGFGHFEYVDARRALRDALAKAWVAVGRPRRVGYEPRWLPAGWRQLAGWEPNKVELFDFADDLELARAIKSDWEIERLKRAAAAADAAQTLLARADLVGINELALWGDLLGAAADVAGHEVTVFADLVTGRRTGTLRYPGGPVNRTIDRGDSVILDFSVRVDGYWADTTTTVIAGAEPNETQRRFYRASRKAFDQAVDCLRPGRRASEAAAAAAAGLADAGIETVHYAGHQIGCALNEPPRLVVYDQTEIKAGMVFAVEPGGYDAGLGVGARSEKVVLVGERGPELLSQFAWPLDDGT